MEWVIGSVLALGVAGLAAVVGFDRERSFGATVLIVVAHYYVLFALIGASSRIVLVESLIACGFLLLSVLGFKTTPWLIAAAMVGHGVFDVVHNFLIQNPGMPRWWPGFCSSFDALFGLWLAGLILRRSQLSFRGTAVGHQGTRDARS